MKMGCNETNIFMSMSLNDVSEESGDAVKNSSTSISLRSYSKWSPREHGVTLAWRDVNIYAVKNARQVKRIINNSAGAVVSGTLCALLGSSGSGKTTLMSALAFRNSCKNKFLFALSDYEWK